jgi:hypothetical protein
MDHFEFLSHERICSISIFRGHLLLLSWDKDEVQSYGWNSDNIVDLGMGEMGASELVRTFNDTYETSHPWCFSTPCWPLVSLLTLLSAYLILWKPRKRVNSDA